MSLEGWWSESSGSRNHGTRKAASLEDLERRVRRLGHRLHDVPHAQALLAAHRLHPEDSRIRELLALVVADLEAAAEASTDPFWYSYPPAGSLPACGAGRIPLAALPTGDVFSVEVRVIFSNILAVGPTGTGKTTWLRVLLCCLLIDRLSTIIAFDRKGDFLECVALAGHDGVVVLHWRDLAISLLEPPPGLGVDAYAPILVELMARHLSLMASRRLLLETLFRLYTLPRAAGTWPLFREWIAHIERQKIAGFRGAQYKEAALWALKSVALSLGSVLDFRASDIFARVASHHGCVVIVTDGLSAEVACLLASLFVNWVYETRGASNRAGTPHQPVFFFLDDAMPLVRGESYREAAEGTNPLATWSFMGRSRSMGFVVAAQNFSLVSPALRGNANTIICTASVGRDAHELSLHLGLSLEQGRRLTELQPGEVVVWARSVWPAALFGRFPEVS